MKSSSFDKLISSNKKFWSGNNRTSSDNGCLLYDVFYSEQMLLHGMSKTALTLANILDLKPIGVHGMKVSKDNFRLIKSMNAFLVGSKFDCIISFLQNIIPILSVFISVRNKNDLLSLSAHNCYIGTCIYDHILARNSIPTLRDIGPKIRLQILMEIGYFFYFKRIVRSNNIKLILIGDNVYRYGLLFEIARINHIECIAPVNLNAYSMHKYETESDFKIHSRKPSTGILDRLCVADINEYVDDYFKKRLSASIEQHDVLRAYSDDKKIYNREELVLRYGLDPDKPIVAVMAHIFCDAPHAYPDTLYDDYYEWMTSTIKSLKKNNNVNFIVKEHPSSPLYKEEGILKSLLSKLGCEHLLLEESVHTLSILNECDTVVTCGGTIGVEFIYMGKRVLLAAKPPYSGFGVTTDPDSKNEYESILENDLIEPYVMSANGHEVANKIIYHDFVLLDNYSQDLELGGQRYYRGRDFDYEKFYKAIIDYNKVDLVDQTVYKILKNFTVSENKSLITKEIA